MRMTKLGHSCIRLEKNGSAMVIDPGGWSEPDALNGADAILITHEHADHFVEDWLRTAAETNPSLEIWTNRSVAEKLSGVGGKVHEVADGDTFSAVGFDVQVRGEWHAIVHPDIPRIPNIGFLVDGVLFHPGDALTFPGRPVGTLMLPLHAPWSRTAELIDYVRAMRPGQVFPVHDAALNEVGRTLLDGLLGDRGPGTGVPYRRLNPGDSIEVP
jgi:L-ascorbate metabolism protein UlaG (beta-lactamase superfamily)